MLAIIKQFKKWLTLKEHLHNKNHQPPFVSERDIWWASIGENIGSEIDGKSDKFSRPVIIFKKLAHGFYFVIPTTTKIKEGSWYVLFEHQEKEMIACLHQARAVDYRRLWSKIGQIDTTDYEQIQEGFERLYIKNIPRSFEQGRG